jgi:hypothetical protein
VAIFDPVLILLDDLKTLRHKYRLHLIDQLAFNYHYLNMERLSPIEIRVRTMVDEFFADRITAGEFKKELTKAKVGSGESRERFPKPGVRRTLRPFRSSLEGPAFLFTTRTMDGFTPWAGVLHPQLGLIYHQAQLSLLSYAPVGEGCGWRSRPGQE